MSMLVFAIVAVVAVLLAWGARRPGGRPRAPEKAVWHCRCPGCRQKLRYRPGRRRRVLCPQCLRVFALPADFPARESARS